MSEKNVRKSEPAPTIHFAHGHIIGRPPDYMKRNWRAIIASQLNSIKNQHQSKAYSLVGHIFGLIRQGIIRQGFKVGPIKLDGTDLQRTHSIVTEIDSRRVFYETCAFEDPRYCFESVQVCREEVRTLSRGIWADKFLESLVQDIQHKLASFVTQVSSHLPPPSEKRFRPPSDVFMTCLERLRLEVWTIVILIMKQMGGAITPKHLPRWILDEVQVLIKD